MGAILTQPVQAAGNVRESASLELLGAVAYAYCVPLDAVLARGTGAVIGDFSYTIYSPAGTVITPVVTLAEYGATGAYRFSVTLPSLFAGNYTLKVTDSYGTTTSCVFQAYGHRFRSEDSTAQLELWIHNAAGVPVTGVVLGDLTVRIYNPSMVDSFASVTPTLTELDASGDPGHYVLAFDASSAEGDWFVDVVHATHFPWGQPGVWTWWNFNALVPSTTPSGSVSLIIENTRLILAASATFQAMVGAENPGEARASILYPIVDATDYARPCAILWFGDGEHPLIGRGLHSEFGERARVGCRIERTIDAADDDAGEENDAYLVFANIIGAILSEIEALAGTATYLDITSIRIADLPRTPLEDESAGTRYYACELEIEVGSQ
jgi:hypothetical protein